MATAAASARVAGLLVDAAAVATAWAGALLAENVAVGFLFRDHFSAAWEVSFARDYVVPLGVAALAPAALAVAALRRLLGATGDSPQDGSGRASPSRPARLALAATGAAAGAATALGVSTGRHFAAAPIRAAFVATVAAASFALFWWGAPRVARLLVRRPTAFALAGAALAAAVWLADEYVLPRLYPAFHLALLVVSLLGAAAVGLAWRDPSASPSRRARVLATAAALAVVGCGAWSPRAARELDRASNVRIVLVEHAPWQGRAVELAARVLPHAPEASSSDAAANLALPPTDAVRTLDWSGHDLLLLTVDALRADHVSAYGYARATTPNLDALAREGALFEHAYCPTPHTSYSVTSMMTGKYLRPLLALGLGDDSETLAEDLRRYGWRTAAFYPPAVFFIDEDRFPRFEASHLGFEYAKVEFAGPELREQQVAAYLDGAPPDVPLFLWVHFFEPHEPYVPHADHAFAGAPSRDVDLYDGEVATADDGIGRIARLMRARRPGAVVVVTADHGEEFGEHGGRYHGTTVYEEQVRVPLVVVGPGVSPGTRVTAVAQTIDLLPTALSALGVPRPARVRGRDVGPLLAGKGGPADGGFAFAETDDYALVAAGAERLVCERRAAACALYRPDGDPLERHDLSRDMPARADELRAMLRAVERDHGRYEATGPAWPEALRRGMQGDAEAAVDVAALLDDASLPIRRKAAELSYALHVVAVAPQLRRALLRDEDEEVRRWAALALARIEQPAPPLAEALLGDGDRAWRRRAALALGERGDARACDELAAWWADVVPEARRTSPDGTPPRLSVDLAQAEQMLGATRDARCRGAVPALLRALDDVRARPHVADALGALADNQARARLLALLATEPYVTTRPHEARALLALGAHDWSAATPEPEVHATLPLARPGPVRLLVLLDDPSGGLAVTLDGAPAAPAVAEGEVRAYDAEATSRRLRVDVRASAGGVVALWASQD